MVTIRMLFDDSCQIALAVLAICCRFLMLVKHWLLVMQASYLQGSALESPNTNRTVQPSTFGTVGRAKCRIPILQELFFRGDDRVYASGGSLFEHLDSAF